MLLKVSNIKMIFCYLAYENSIKSIRGINLRLQILHTYNMGYDYFIAYPLLSGNISILLNIISC